jgi:long-chain acyl-CoA synthetase
LNELTETEQLTFPALLSASVRKFGTCNALALVGEKPLTYLEMNVKIQALISFLEKTGIRQGDKVAILSTNQPNWGIAYYALASMGVTVVPLLPDFLPSEIDNILNHSESKAIFVSSGLWYKLEGLECGSLQHRIRIEDFEMPVPKASGSSYDASSSPAGTYQVKETDLAAIIYTSGTTGKSKGVMLTHRNICFTAIKSGTIQHIDEHDRFLSILPLSHAYENTIGLVLPMLRGACVYYLGKAPVISVLLPALKEVKPTLMLTVPLIIEKVYRSSVLPKIREHRITTLLYKIPYTRKKMNVIAGKKLMQTFGGELKFFGIGGAKLNRNVEKFLREARFPYAIGYGLTETAPLLAGFNPQNSKWQSTGPVMEGVQLKIHQPDPKTGEGEIWAKGPNVMLGYYKEPAMTSEVMTPDGWFRTGDLGMFDKSNYLFIKGRLKNMIVGSGGENIYPEEIESVINNFKYVVESLVMEKQGKLVALVHFNREEIETRYLHLKEELSNYVEQKIEELLEELQEYVNARVNKFSRVQLVLVQPEPFQKTATQKIQRYLYT